MYYDEESEKNDIESYLEAKYGEDFEIKSIENPDYLTDCYYARAKKCGDDESRIFLVLKEKGPATNGEYPLYRDTYFHMQKRDELEENVEDMISSLIFNDSKVYITDSVAPFSESDMDAFYYIFVKENTFSGRNFDIVSEELYKKMSLNGQGGLVRLFLVNNELYDRVERNNCDRILPDYYTADGKKCLALSRKVVKTCEGAR